jgi:hypothetical protein
MKQKYPSSTKDLSLIITPKKLRNTMLNEKTHKDIDKLFYSPIYDFAFSNEISTSPFLDFLSDDFISSLLRELDESPIAEQQKNEVIYTGEEEIEDDYCDNDDDGDDDDNYKICKRHIIFPDPVNPPLVISPLWLASALGDYSTIRLLRIINNKIIHSENNKNELNNNNNNNLKENNEEENIKLCVDLDALKKNNDEVAVSSLSVHTVASPPPSRISSFILPLKYDIPLPFRKPTNSDDDVDIDDDYFYSHRENSNMDDYNPYGLRVKESRSSPFILSPPQRSSLSPGVQIIRPTQNNINMYKQQKPFLAKLAGITDIHSGLGYGKSMLGFDKKFPNFVSLTSPSQISVTMRDSYMFFFFYYINFFLAQN